MPFVDDVLIRDNTFIANDSQRHEKVYSWEKLTKHVYNRTWEHKEEVLNFPSCYLNYI